MAGLKYLLGDASRQIVLKKAKRLLHHMHVALPAGGGKEVGNDQLFLDQCAKQDDDDPCDKRHRHHHRERRSRRFQQPVPAAALLRFEGCQDIDELADEGEHQCLDRRIGEAEQQHEAECPAELADEIPGKGEKPTGWRIAAPRKRIEPVFKPTENPVEHAMPFVLQPGSCRPMDKTATPATLLRGLGGVVHAEEPTRLARPQFRIQTAGGCKLAMRTLLDDLAFVHDHQPVERGDG